MAIYHYEFLQFAERFEESSEEVERRVCASKAYYAAFHCCAPISDNLPPAPDDVRGSHARRIWQLMNPGPMMRDKGAQTKIKKAGLWLQVLRDARVRADYRIEESFEPASAQDAVTKARRIIENASCDEVKAAVGV